MTSTGVLLVGAGPSGLTLANVLADHGVGISSDKLEGTESDEIEKLQNAKIKT
jgi:2-polyprenyl-6-methoxyphenol hydroxylase-like FAD-dependent oxidoreductase